MFKQLFSDISKSYKLSGIIFGLLGVLLVIWPMASVVTIIKLIGLAGIVNGGIHLFRYFQQKLPEFKINLYIGVISLLVGLILNFYAVNLITLIPIILGLVLLACGGSNVAKSIECKKAGDEKWYSLALPSAGLCALGVLMMLNPFSSTAIMIRVAGVGCLVQAFNELVKSKHVTQTYNDFEDFTTAFKSPFTNSSDVFEAEVHEKK